MHSTPLPHYGWPYNGDYYFSSSFWCSSSSSSRPWCLGKHTLNWTLRRVASSLDVWTVCDLAAAKTNVIVNQETPGQWYCAHHFRNKFLHSTYCGPPLWKASLRRATSRNFGSTPRHFIIPQYFQGSTRVVQTFPRVAIPCAGGFVVGTKGPEP